MAQLDPEIARRASDSSKVLALFQRQRQQWIPWTDFAAIAPCAWRTRVADARKIARRDGDEIVWNGDNKHSCYMLRPKALARSAEIPIDRVQQAGLTF